MRLRPHIPALLVVLVVGCPESMTTTDASSDAPTSHAPLPPTPPSAPAAPVLTPCPTAWREIAVDGVTACEPFAEETTPRCDADEILVHGRPTGLACEPASPCPSGEWPDDAPSDAIYARAGATDGDGSRARPFGTLTEAIAAASAGGLPIMLGEGELVGGVQVRGVPSITGLCPSRTRIVDTVTTNSASLIVRAGALTLRGLALDGALYGLWLTDGADVQAEGVVAVGASSAIRLDGGAILDATRVRAESPRTNDLEQPALRLGPEATATVRASTLIGGGSLAYGYRRMSDPSEVFATLVIEDSTLLDAEVGLAGRLEATLRRTAIDGVGVGVVTISPRTTVLEDVRARDVGVGVASDSAFVNAAGGTTTLRRVSIVGVERGLGLLVQGVSPDASLVAEDVIVARVGGDVAVQASDGASLRVDRVLVSDAQGTAIAVDGGARAEIQDATLTSLGRGSDDTFGSAIAALELGTSITVERVVARVPAYGLAVLDGAIAHASDVSISGGLGMGVQCDPSGTCNSGESLLVIDRGEVRGVLRYGVAAIAARATVRDLAIDDVVTTTTSGAPGVGVLAYLGDVDGARVRVGGVEGIGLVAIGARVALEDLEVGRTDLRACDGCASGTLGDGITCAVDGSLALSNVLVHGSARAGITAARGCLTPQFAGGVVEQNGIGVLTDESVDVSLFRTLLVRDNGTDYDRISLTLSPEELGLTDSSL